MTSVAVTALITEEEAKQIRARSRLLQKYGRLLVSLENIARSKKRALRTTEVSEDEHADIVRWTE